MKYRLRPATDTLSEIMRKIHQGLADGDFAHPVAAMCIQDEFELALSERMFDDLGLNDEQHYNLLGSVIAAATRFYQVLPPVVERFIRCQAVLRNAPEGLDQDELHDSPLYEERLRELIAEFAPKSGQWKVLHCPNCGGAHAYRSEWYGGIVFRIAYVTGPEDLDQLTEGLEERLEDLGVRRSTRERVMDWLGGVRDNILGMLPSKPETPALGEARPAGAIEGNGHSNDRLLAREGGDRVPEGQFDDTAGGGSDYAEPGEGSHAPAQVVSAGASAINDATTAGAAAAASSGG